MTRFWKALFFAAFIGQSLQEEASTDEKMQRKFLAIAQCEAIYEHMCPSGLCTVESASNQMNERDDGWTPAQHFCDAACLLNDGCRTVCSCANEKITKVLSETKPRGFSSPMLHCKEPSFLSIKWDFLGDNNTQKEPIVFAIEMHVYGKSHWKPYKLTRKNIAVIEGLLPRQKYRFRVFAVSPSGIIGNASFSEWISTLPSASEFESGSSVLDPPLSVEQIGPIEYSSKSASLRIGWKSGQNASCTYEVLWYSNMLERDIPSMPYSRKYYVAESPMEGQLENLLLNHTYVISVKSLLHQYEVESSMLEMAPLPIKDCLVAFNHNLTICRPPAPTKLNLNYVRTDNKTMKVKVSWAPVKGHPTGYNISLYGSTMKFLDSRLVSGTDTVAVFENIPEETNYHAKAWAYSPAGKSPVAFKMKKVKSSGDSKDTGAAAVVRPYTEQTPTRNTLNDTPVNRNDGSVTPIERVELSDHLGIYLSVGGAMVAVAALFAAFLRSRERRKEQGMAELVEQVKRSSESPFQESPDLGASDLHLCEQIGEGAFGNVWLGLLSDPIKGTIEVAVKMLKENPSVEDSRHFENEMSILKSVKQHPNVVRFMGCITHTPEKKIIMEYCKFGDLQKFLKMAWKDFMKLHCENLNCSNNVVGAMPGAIELRMYENCPALANSTYGMMLGADRIKFSAELISFARQVASGMEFLTESGILHRDLAARNVLIAGDRNIRISDFGLSREVLETSVYRKLGSERVAIKWIAPEAFETRVFTTKSDVWSYGILLWEIVTLGSSPYASIDNVLEFLRRGSRLSQPCNCSDDLYEWMLRCWDKNPDNRPTFQVLREHMENLERSGEHLIALDNDKIVTFNSIRSAESEERG